MYVRCQIRSYHFKIAFKYDNSNNNALINRIKKPELKFRFNVLVVFKI